MEFSLIADSVSFLNELSEFGGTVCVIYFGLREILKKNATFLKMQNFFYICTPEKIA